MCTDHCGWKHRLSGGNMKVISNNLIASETYEMILEIDSFETVEPGQFMHLRSGREDHVLRRPISIASFEDGKMSLIYKVVGEGTASLSTFKEGQTVDALGPLGSGFQVLDFKEVLVVGGGMGVAPLYQLGKTLVAKGAKVTFVLGFASDDVVYYLDKFMELGQVVITTDDGSMGVKGHVGNVVDHLDDFDAIYACGPLPLLHYLKKKFENHPHLYISLEQRMACGIGACYACDTKDKKHRVCHDGPVFNAKEVEI